MISILVVTYNSERFIRETLESCLRQTIEEFEIVVSDDRSRDRTWDIIDEFSDPRIRKFRQPTNLGEYGNRNFCVEQARGDYCIFIDGDDLIYPQALALLQEHTRAHADAAMFIGRHWDERVVYPKRLTPELFAMLNFRGRGYLALNFTCLLFHRQRFLASGAFDRKDVKLGDAYIQEKLGLTYPSVLISDGFSWWRRRRGQASERLLGDPFEFFQDLARFRPQHIAATDRLQPEDKRIALANFYGGILRYTLRQLLRLQFARVVRFLRERPIPTGHFGAILKRPQIEFGDQYDGESPLRDS